MRIALNALTFAAVFALALALFQSSVHALLAGVILACAGDTLIWSEPKKQ